MVILPVFPVIDPGLRIHVLAGNPLNTTLPVATSQVGCVIAPTIGAEGFAGGVSITTLADMEEIHPNELETV